MSARLKDYLVRRVLRVVGMIPLLLAAQTGQSSPMHVPSLDFQTSFEEARLGAYAPVNSQTSIGLPGVVPIAYSNLMRLRGSEFELLFEMGDDGPREPWLREGFRQRSPEDWLPGCVSEWDAEGVHYEVGLIMVPNDPQPVDVVRIVLRNDNTVPRRAALATTIDGAPTLLARDDLISDHDKPLILMNPPARVERLARKSGCLDPRTKAAILHNPAMPSIWPDWEWMSCRVGFYGMPVEYILRVEDDQPLQVLVGFHANTPMVCRELEVSVEGDPNSQRVDLFDEAAPHARPHMLARTGLRFVGRDLDGDGAIRVRVCATDAYRQRAVLNVVGAYDIATPVSVEDFLLDHNLPEARVRINVGADASSQADLRSAGLDPTAHALRLHYDPMLQPGEERTYELRFPAIDRPEPAAHTGFTPRPYDTGESWKQPYLARHPENIAPFGFDVPLGVDPTEYGAFGPKSRGVWQEQLDSARRLDWDTGLDRVRAFWEDYLDNGTEWLVPESVVDHLLRKQIIHLSVHRIRFSQHPYFASLDGPDFYWEHTPRGASYEYVALDWAGFGGMARESLETWLTPRSELPVENRWGVGQYDTGEPETDGMWLTRPEQWDGQGQTLWAVTEHYLLHRDRDWLRRHYGAITRGGDWIIRRIAMERERLGDPEHPAYGLMPLAGDEPPIGAGHSIYVNGMSYLGLARCAMMARELGRDADVDRFSRVAEALRDALDRAIDASFVRLGPFSGTFPENVEIGVRYRSGAVDGRFSTRTDFFGSLLYPTRAVDPHDWKVDALAQYRERQSASSGGVMMWPYIYAEDGVARIVRGEADKGCDLFYALVANASETLDWGEEQYLSNGRHRDYPPWLNREGIVGHGESPHTWASSLFVEWVRHMLLHEDGDTLHLAAGIPRKWLASSEPVGMERAPSHFGPITYRLWMDETTLVRGEIRLDPRRKPGKLVIHVRLPGGRALREVVVNGQPHALFGRGEIVVADPPDEIALSATLDPPR